MSLNIKEIDVCCPLCLSNALLSEFTEVDDFDGVSVYSDVDTITELMKILICSEFEGEEFALGMIDIDGQCCDYDREYVLTISDDMTVWIEPAYREIDGEWTLFDSESYVTFVDKNCNSEILARLIKNEQDIILFDFDCEEE